MGSLKDSLSLERSIHTSLDPSSRRDHYCDDTRGIRQISALVLDSNVCFLDFSTRSQRNGRLGRPSRDRDTLRRRYRRNAHRDYPLFKCVRTHNGRNRVVLRPGLPYAQLRDHHRRDHCVCVLSVPHRWFPNGRINHCSRSNDSDCCSAHSDRHPYWAATSERRCGTLNKLHKRP